MISWVRNLVRDYHDLFLSTRILDSEDEFSQSNKKKNTDLRRKVFSVRCCLQGPKVAYVIYFFITHIIEKDENVEDMSINLRVPRVKFQ